MNCARCNNTLPGAYFADVPDIGDLCLPCHALWVDSRPAADHFRTLDWVTLVALNGAEHFVAEHGWLLARVQRGARPNEWLWSVGTHEHPPEHGIASGPGDAQQCCREAIEASYARLHAKAGD